MSTVGPSEARTGIESFSLSPENIASTLNGGRKADVIEQNLRDDEQRKALAFELLQKVPSLQKEYPDVVALYNKLGQVAEVLPKKKSFLSKTFGTAWEKTKAVLGHPLVKYPLIALLTAWGLSKLFAFLKNNYADLAKDVHDGMTRVGGAAKSLSPVAGLTEKGSGLVGGPGGFLPRSGSPYNAPLSK